MVMTVAFFVCCAFYPHFTNKISKWIIIGGLILALIIATIVGVTTGYGEPSNSSSVSTNNSSSTKSYIITFNKDGGSGGTSSVSAKKGQSMPYATAPTKKGYTLAVITPLVTGKEQNTIAIVCQVVTFGIRLQT